MRLTVCVIYKNTVIFLSVFVKLQWKLNKNNFNYRACRMFWPAGLMSSSLWSMFLVGVGVGMFLVCSSSRRFLIRRTEDALWLAALLNDCFCEARDERIFPAADAGRWWFATARCPDELIAVDARKFARLTCCAEADLVERRSSVLERGRYEL